MDEIGERFPGFAKGNMLFPSIILTHGRAAKTPGCFAQKLCFVYFALRIIILVIGKTMVLVLFPIGVGRQFQYTLQPFLDLP